MNSAFNTRNTDLDLRPLYHTMGELSTVYLYLGLQPDGLVNINSHQLKRSGISAGWKEINCHASMQISVFITVQSSYDKIIPIIGCRTG